MKHRCALLLLLFAFAAFHSGFAATIIATVTGGDWNDGASWAGGSVPGCGDTIVIPATATVTITDHVNLDENSTPACSTAVHIQVFGTLDFNSGKKMYLSCNSGVVVEAGGSVTGGGGGGSSNLIDICGVTEWQAGDGDLSGPVVVGSGSPLPIELIYFEAHLDIDGVELHWITATELNNDFFTVERSADGEHWEELIITGGAGNSTTIIEYYETDYDPPVGIFYYRLKQTDYNGTSAYFNIVPVHNETGNGSPEVSIWPNPWSQSESAAINLNGFEGKEVLVVVRDITGQEFYSKVIVAERDNELVAIDPMGNIPPGMYLVTASSCNDFYSKQIIIR